MNRISSALLPWFLCLSFLPHRVALTTDSTPTSAAATSVSAVATQPAVDNNRNANLIFEGSAASGGLRYCSCPVLPVRHCDESLANMLCACHSAASPSAGLREPGGLMTVWLRDAGLLRDLLNGSQVRHLQLVSCGEKPLDTQYLALLGLRTLRIHSSSPGVPYPDQELTIAAPDATAEEGEEGADVGHLAPLRLTFLDVALLSGLSALKAYSVAGESVSSLATQFPHLPLALLLRPPAGAPGGSPGSRDRVRDPDGKCLLTFVY